jgi:hypothetical protein
MSSDFCRGGTLCRDRRCAARLPAERRATRFTAAFASGRNVFRAVYVSRLA